MISKYNSQKINNSISFFAINNQKTTLSIFRFFKVQFLSFSCFLKIILKNFFQTNKINPKEKYLAFYCFVSYLLEKNKNGEKNQKIPISSLELMIGTIIVCCLFFKTY